MDRMRASRVGAWIVILAMIVLAVVGIAMLGPFGVLIAVPALLLLWLLLAGSTGGPAAGA
jgi:hypothetical protein